MPGDAFPGLDTEVELMSRLRVGRGTAGLRPYSPEEEARMLREARAQLKAMRPSLLTDAYEDDTDREPPMIFLAGPIKHWWTCWGSYEHKRYIGFRDLVRHELIKAGYLTYAPWDAIKGTWNPRAQAINDAAIAASDLLLVLTPTGVPADGTEDESDYARRVQTPQLWVPMPLNVRQFLSEVDDLVGPGVPYDD